MEPGKYLVLATATVRAGPEPDSDKIGEHKTGTVIDVVAEAINATIAIAIVAAVTTKTG